MNLENGDQFQSSQARSNTKDILILILLILGFITSFVGGFFVKDLFVSEVPFQSNGKITPVPSVSLLPQSQPTQKIDTSNQGTIQESTRFLPGEYYFEDTLIVLTKSQSPKSLVATVTRNGKNFQFFQTVRTSFFDGNNWVRKINTQETLDSAIVSSELLKKWQITIDTSRVLKQDVSGEMNVEGNNIQFSTGLLFNEIGMRSLPGYTKFMSQGQGKVIINQRSEDAYYLYTRVYSLNSSEIQAYDKNLKLTTDWIIFWANDGSFYHIDKTSVPNPIDTYQTHEIGIYEDIIQRVSKTFQVSIERDSLDSPQNYSIFLGSPIGEYLKIHRLNMINKAPNSAYIWQMGMVNGNITRQNGETLEGVGLFEYIKN